MAARRRPQIFPLPKSKFRIIVCAPEHVPGDAKLNMLDTVAIAAREGFRGLGMWMENKLMIPPQLPQTLESGSKDLTVKLKEEFSKWLDSAFTRASREAARTVLIVLVSSCGDNIDILMADWLVEKLSSFAASDHVIVDNQQFSQSRDFFVVGRGMAMSTLLRRLSDHLGISCEKRGSCSRTSEPSPSNLPSQSQSAGQSGDNINNSSSSSNNYSNNSSSSENRSNPNNNNKSNSSSLARSAGTGNLFTPMHPETVLSQRFSQGGFIRGFGNPVPYQCTSQWDTPAHSQPRGDDDDQHRGGDSEHCMGLSARGGTSSGPQQLLISQYYAFYDQAGSLQATYICSRDTNARTGTADPCSEVHIVRCWHVQKVTGQHSNDLDSYITEVTDSNEKEGRKAAARTSQPEAMTVGDGEGEEEPDADSDSRCPICLTVFQRPTRVKKCGHVFCRPCLEMALKHDTRCPLCRQAVAVMPGNMPDGEMIVCAFPWRLPGQNFSTIGIHYDLDGGVQQDNHPNPGMEFEGTKVFAFLPASEEGFRVCRLLWVAFRLRLTFTMGEDNKLRWNDIEHVTNPHDFVHPDFLRHVTEDLAEKGITDEFIQNFSIPF